MVLFLIRRLSADGAGKDVVVSESAKVISKYHRLTTCRVSYVEQNVKIVFYFLIVKWGCIISYVITIIFC